MFSSLKNPFACAVATVKLGMFGFDAAMRNRSSANAGGETRAAVTSTSKIFIVTSPRSEEHTSELQSQFHLVCRLLLEKKNQIGRKPGMTRMDLLKTNADIVKGVCDKIKNYAADSKIIVVTNTLGPFTYIVL